MYNPNPPKYQTAEEIGKKIDQYFEKCPDKRETIVDGKVKRVECPTWTGLALYLGFVNRQSMLDYEKRSEFTAVIRYARAMIEKVYEMNLRDAKCTGAIFALKNLGWKDEQTNRWEFDHEVKEILDKYGVSSVREFQNRIREVMSN